MTTRLIDRMLRRKIVPPPWLRETPARIEASDREIKAKLAAAEVILADDVAGYLYEEAGKAHWDIDRDFPQLVPPFARFWVEWTRRSRFHARAACDPVTVGILFRANTTAAYAAALRRDRRALLDHNQRTARFLQDRFRLGDRDPEATECLGPAAHTAWDNIEWRRLIEQDPAALDLLEQMPGDGYVLRGEAFIEQADREIVGPAWEWALILDSAGAIQLPPVGALPMSEDGILPDLDLSPMNGIIFPALLALSWWNGCRPDAKVTRGKRAGAGRRHYHEVRRRKRRSLGALPAQ